MNVLIVDDSKVARQILTEVVSKYFLNSSKEINIFEAEDGAAAIDKMREENIQIMFLDWNMPKMTGKDVVQVVRRNKEWNKVRIIMATAEGEKSKVIQMIKGGVNSYLLKPFQEENVFKTLDSVIAKISK